MRIRSRSFPKKDSQWCSGCYNEPSYNSPFSTSQFHLGGFLGLKCDRFNWLRWFPHTYTIMSFVPIGTLKHTSCRKCGNCPRSTQRRILVSHLIFVNFAQPFGDLFATVNFRKHSCGATWLGWGDGGWTRRWRGRRRRGRCRRSSRNNRRGNSGTALELRGITSLGRAQYTNQLDVSGTHLEIPSQASGMVFNDIFLEVVKQCKKPACPFKVLPVSVAMLVRKTKG